MKFERFPMTRSAQSLKEELEGTRKALRHQTIRCRQLVLAYSTKTKETELKLKQSEDLRERQLSHLLRVLYVLEAKLRKEQKSIREQLVQKDSVIIKQREEIESLNSDTVCKRCLKKIIKERGDEEAYEIRTESSEDSSYNSGSHSDDLAAENSKPDLISSITYPTSKHKSMKEKVQSRDVKKSVKFDINLTKISNSVEEESNEKFTCSPGDDSNQTNTNETNGNNNNEFQDNPVLKCVNQILLRDKEDSEDEDKKNTDGYTCSMSRNEKLDKGKLKNLEKGKNQTTSNYKPPPRVPPKPLNLNWIGRKIFPSEQSSKIKSKLAFMKSQFSLDNFSMNNGNSMSSDDELYVISNSALDEIDEMSEKSSDNISDKTNETTNNVMGRNDNANIGFNSLEDINMEIIETKDKTDISPKVSLMVRKFEDLRGQDKAKLTLKEEEDFGSNELRNNFEEFNFDDCEVGSVVETESEQEVQNRDTSVSVQKTNNSAMAPLPPENGVTYEKFLEATGLSQKSIVTPSRIMRPKDVKHRSRAKAAAANYVDRCGTSEYVLGSTTKYWTEPFL
uniref:Uncharacterized protein n=2 Tax=Cacopsylla melanoneura TaxID=428564 RepID=A0A8D8WEJ8_9HEMI